MRTVQEIEAALSRLPIEELEAIEKSICRLKQKQHEIGRAHV